MSEGVLEPVRLGKTGSAGVTPYDARWQARWVRQQQGVLRYNCADSLDRTNAASYFAAVQVGSAGARLCMLMPSFLIHYWVVLERVGWELAAEPMGMLAAYACEDGWLVCMSQAAGCQAILAERSIHDGAGDHTVKNGIASGLYNANNGVWEPDRICRLIGDAGVCRVTSLCRLLR